MKFLNGFHKTARQNKEEVAFANRSRNYAIAAAVNAPLSYYVFRELEKMKELPPRSRMHAGFAKKVLPAINAFSAAVHTKNYLEHRKK